MVKETVIHCIWLAVFFFWLIFEWLSFDCDEVDMAMLTGEGSGVESPVIVHNIRNALFGD